MRTRRRALVTPGLLLALVSTSVARGDTSKYFAMVEKLMSTAGSVKAQSCGGKCFEGHDCTTCVGVRVWRDGAIHGTTVYDGASDVGRLLGVLVPGVFEIRGDGLAAPRAVPAGASYRLPGAFPVAARPGGAAAAEAALCADAQGKYWEMHRRLFVAKGGAERTTLVKHAHDVGLDESRFDECLSTGEQRARWSRDVADGTRLGVRVAPTVFVNGRLLLDPPTEESLREEIRAELR